MAPLIRTSKPAIILALVTVTIAAPAAAQPAGADLVCVPFELVGGHMFVRAGVNGHGPYNFLFDTGASGMGRADSRLAAALQLPRLPPTTNSDGVNTSTIDVVRARTVTLGGLRQDNVELLSRDYNTRPRPHGLQLGIIGAEFFADRLLTIDYPARQLRFSRTARLGADDPAAVPYAEPFRIPITIGAETATGSIDTGSNLTLHIPDSLLAKINADPPVDAGQGRRANTTFQLRRARLHDPVRVGSVAVPNVEARFSALATEVNIGNGFLADHVLQIDQRSRRVALRPATDPAIAAERRRGCR